MTNTATPAFASTDEWIRISGMSRRTTQRMLSAGVLKAIKFGPRTLIDVEAGLAFLRSLPSASRAAREARAGK